MSVAIFLLNIDDYEPEIRALTWPLIHRYADKIRAEVRVISERKFPEWDIDYEKLQIYELGRAYDWSIYIDSDAIVHPELPDLTALIPRDTVTHHGSDFAGVRWRYDDYFRRDGRHISSCNWFAMASRWCLDLWRPLDDLTPAEAVAAIHLSVAEEQSGCMKPAHLVSDYACSRNIARFGLKFTTLIERFQALGLGQSQFFWHAYNIPAHDTVDAAGAPVPGKLSLMRKVLADWQLA